jgi:hypothetical protein
VRPLGKVYRYIASAVRKTKNILAVVRRTGAAAELIRETGPVSYRAAGRRRGDP